MIISALSIVKGILPSRAAMLASHPSPIMQEKFERAKEMIIEAVTKGGGECFDMKRNNMSGNRLVQRWDWVLLTTEILFVY